MGKTVSQAMTFEVGAEPVKRLSRKWAVKETSKHLDKLSTFAILWYLVKRHENGLTWLGFLAGWVCAGLLAFN